MNIVRFIDTDGVIRLGTDRNGDTAAEVIETSGNFFSSRAAAVFERTGKARTIQTFLPPVQPAAIICVGLNYTAHAAETKMEPPQYPVIFMKNPASVLGHRQNIVLPKSCREKPQVDFEAELAVIIAKPARNVRSEEALTYVKGYTIANDISARVWQKHAGGGQWVRGKSFDTFCPLGPELVTADAISNPDRLAISCILNGQTMQNSNTSDMIFSISRLIEYISEDTTLLPDTVILTGTPAGVGFARKPPVYLKPGDMLVTTVEKLGTLENRIV